MLAPLLLVLLAVPSANAAGTCSRVAASNGSDAAAGTEAAPYATAQKLVDSLGAGETGCLRSGTYVEDVKVSRGGSADARVTLRSFPGERATVKGRFWIAEGADFVTVAQLDLNGVNERRNPSPTVNSNDAIFEEVDVTNEHTEICFLLGNDWGRAHRTIIRRSRVHDCGRLPAANQDHGIYVGMATDTQILDNFIYDNADRGVQLYPDAQRTKVLGNVIDGNGEGIIFGGENGFAPNENLVEGNVITNAKVRYNVESWFAAGNPIGRSNVVRRNCVFNGRDGNIAQQIGFTASENIVRDPQFVDRGAKDFRLADSSPCKDVYTSAGAASGSAGTPTTTSTGSRRCRRTCPRPIALKRVGSRRRARGWVTLEGRLVSRAAQAHSAGVRRVAIRVRTRRGWTTIAHPRPVGNRFTVVLRVSGRRALRLRAVVPQVGRSRTLTLRRAR